MAYQRPTGNNSNQAKSQGGYNNQAKSQVVAGSKPAAAAPAPKAQQSSSDGGSAKGNKPDFRLAIVEKDGEGKYRTIKGEDGKTVYAGAAWKNNYEGFNIKIEQDIPAGAQVRAYPVEDKPQT